MRPTDDHSVSRRARTALFPVPVLLLLPLLVLLTACNGSSDKRGTSSRGKPTVRAGAADPVSGGRPSTSPSSSPSRCGTADLTVTIPDVPATDPSQRQARVTFTNRSARSCTLYGFPGAQLRTSGGEVWELVRSTQVPSTRIVVAPGTQAHATLSYLPLDPTQRDAVAFAPATLVLTPPDERTSLQVPWTLGPLLRQDGATHPGTYIAALEPGA